MKKRYLIISDIHSNEEALNSVLRNVSRKKYDKVLCLGDVVGYGGSPNQVTKKIQKIKNLKIVRGNHDKAVIDDKEMANFNNSAKIAAKWTMATLTKENLNFIKSIPKGPIEIDEGIVICHGSPIDEDYYLFSEFDAYQVFENFKFDVCFFGHTHFPCIFALTEKGVTFSYLRGSHIVEILKKGVRYLINPGSVGQPRDRNPNASFAEFYPEVGKFVLKRVEYDIEKAKKKILREKLPESLANRLEVGS